jgi:hypothetical protein
VVLEIDELSPSRGIKVASRKEAAPATKEKQVPYKGIYKSRKGDVYSSTCFVKGLNCHFDNWASRDSVQYNTASATFCK